MTDWIYGARQSGRSTELMYIAAEKDLLIITGDNRSAEYLWHKAQELGLEIRKPEPLSAWLRKPHLFFDYKMEHPGILVDDADFVLECLLRTKVVAAVIETEFGCHSSIVPGGE